jgi:hypothetical protein
MSNYGSALGALASPKAQRGKFPITFLGIFKEANHTCLGELFLEAWCASAGGLLREELQQAQSSLEWGPRPAGLWLDAPLEISSCRP